MRYTPPHNPWGKGNRKTLAQSSAFYLKPEYPPRVTKSMAELKWQRECNKFNKKHRRNAVGMLRAFGAKFFFHGCYPGAEND